MDIYTRKEENKARATNLGYDVVIRLIESFKMSGQNITCDNFFTSLNLGRKLLQKNLTVVRTIRKNRKELPTQFVDAKEREVFLNFYGF